MRFIREMNENKGSILIESIVGISLVLVGMLGIISLIIRSSAFYNSAVNNLQATYLAAEGIETVKNILDTDYVSNGNRWVYPTDGWYYVDYNTPAFVVVGSPPPSSAQFVKFDSASGVYNNQTGTDTIFRRIVNLQNTSDSSGASYVDVKSYVSWIEGGNQKQVLLEDHFYPWRPNF